MFSLAKMNIVMLLSLCTIATINYEVYGWRPNLSKLNEDLDLEKQLRLINKPPIKTIQTEFGSIVDCIDINKQLAFDNPLLKNHKIQLKPSFEDTKPKVQAHDRYPKIGLWKNSCPKGTVPVKRTTKEDLIRANNIGTLTRSNPGTHVAEVHLNWEPIYFGIQGSLNTYNPAVGKGQMSGGYIWVSNGTNDADVNTIQAGWQVYPDLSGDNKTHFFASWSNSNQKTGCTNMLCAGFVQISQRIYLGTPVTNVSTYGGPQFAMSLNLSQDPLTNNWWLKAEELNVGYFPAALFENNLLYASHAGWSGATLITSGDLSPPMGSGHFPDGNPRHSCYIGKMLFKNQHREDTLPLRELVETFTDNPGCYDVKYYDYKGDILQHVLMFGGPGGYCGN